MFCGKCGNKMEDGAKFCSKCGYALLDEVQNEDQNTGTQPIQPVYDFQNQSVDNQSTIDDNLADGTKKKKSKKGLIITLSIILAVIIAGVVVFLVINGSPANQAKKSFDEMMTVIKTGNPEKMSEYFGNDITKASPMFEGEDGKQVLQGLVKNLDYKINSTEAIDDKSVKLNVDITNTDMEPVFTDFVGKAFTSALGGAITGSSQEDQTKKMKELFIESLNNENNPTVTNTTDVMVYKIDNKWKTDATAQFINDVFGGFDNALENADKNFTNSYNSNDNTQPSTAPTAVTSKPTEASTEAPIEITYFKTGDTIESKNVNTTLVEAKTYESISEGEYLNYTPGAGKIYLVLFLEVENKSSESQYVSSLDVKSTVDGYSASSAILPAEVEGYKELSGDMESGAKAKGYVAYEVDSNWKEFIFYLKDDFRIKEYAQQFRLLSTDFS